MKFVLKTAMTGLGLVLILAGIGAILVFTQVDALAKGIVIRGLDEVFPSAVDFDSIVFSPIHQSMEIHGFTLANPDKFKQGPAIKCERVVVEMDAKTIFDKTPVIKKIVFEGAEIYYRYELGHGTNIGRLAKIADKADDNPKEPSLIIQELRCEDAQVHFTTNLLPRREMDIDLVSIRLEDLDTDPPIPTRRLASIFLKSLLSETLSIKGVKKSDLEAVREEIAELEVANTEMPKKIDEEPKKKKKRRKKDESE